MTITSMSYSDRIYSILILTTVDFYRIFENEKKKIFFYEEQKQNKEPRKNSFEAIKNQSDSYFKFINEIETNQVQSITMLIQIVLKIGNNIHELFKVYLVIFQLKVPSFGGNFAATSLHLGA